MRCLRRNTSRFWIIRFSDWRNRIRKIIALCWRNWDGWCRWWDGWDGWWDGWDGWCRRSRNLRVWEFWVTKIRICCEAEFVKELDLNELESKLGFWTIASLGLKKWRKHKLETDIGIAGLTETGKIWHPEWSLSTKLDVELEFALKMCAGWHTRILNRSSS